MCLRVFFAAFSLLLIAEHAYSQPRVPLDLDGDGRSDFVIINISNDGTLNWKVYSARGRLLTSVSSLGKNGNHIAPTNWDGAGIRFGLLESTPTKTISWSAYSGSQSLGSFSFGRPRDVLLAGGDYDGNGVGDAVLYTRMRASSRDRRWVFKFNPLLTQNSANVRRRPLRLGKVDDLAFYASPDGARDWVGILRKGASGVGSSITLRDPFSKAKRVFRFPDYNVTGNRPLPIARSDGRDMIALVTKDSGTTNVKVVSLDDGSLVAEKTFDGIGEIIVGDYRLEPGEEIAFQTSKGFIVYSPLYGVQGSIDIPAGIPIDEVNIVSFRSDGGGGSCQNETRNPRDGHDGFLWKPISDSTGLLAIHVPAEFTGNVKEIVVKDPTGVPIETGRYGGVGNGGRYLARFSKPGRAYPKNAIVSVVLEAGCTVNYRIDSPSQRID